MLLAHEERLEVATLERRTVSCAGYDLCLRLRPLRRVTHGRGDPLCVLRVRQAETSRSLRLHDGPDSLVRRDQSFR